MLTIIICYFFHCNCSHCIGKRTAEGGTRELSSPKICQLGILPLFTTFTVRSLQSKAFQFRIERGRGEGPVSGRLLFLGCPIFLGQLPSSAETGLVSMGGNPSFPEMPVRKTFPEKQFYECTLLLCVKFSYCVWRLL